MQTQSNSIIFKALKRKTVMVEILNFLDLNDINKSFTISKQWHSLATGCIANYNTKIVIKAGQFGEDFQRYLDFIYWMTRRMAELNSLQATVADKNHSLV
jgi:hypothetical protein